MLLIASITSVINTIILVGIIIKYFKDNYTICTIEEWNTVTLSKIVTNMVII